MEEISTDLDKGKIANVRALGCDLEQNLQKIIYHGKRADSIVKNMLQHSAKNSENKECVSINALADEYLRLGYHAVRVRNSGLSVCIRTLFDEQIEAMELRPQEIGRVLLNIYNNAFYAVAERMERCEEGYEPTVSVATKRDSRWIEIAIHDNGTGIPQQIIDKIFQPFFTTKPTGEGTGLGLSLSYDIITKGHGGELLVETREGEGTTFTILLPAPPPADKLE